MDNSFVFGTKERTALGLLGATALFCVSVAVAVEPPPGGFYPEKNTALGQDALFNYLIGGTGQNVAIGYNAMFSNTAGDSNTAVGDSALYSNVDGEANVALGYWAIHENTSGSRNVAVGEFALVNNTTADNNTAVGDAAMQGNTTGFYNAAFGSRSMNFNTTGRFNTALGSGTLSFNTVGESNTAVGFATLNQVTTGTSNIALGALAGTSLVTGSNNIEIGHTGASATESNTIRIGTRGTQTATYIAGIRGVALGALQQIGVNAQGQLGVRGSAARFKEAIKPIGEQSETILSLRPVSFRYKKELDPSREAQFGLVAEDVAKVAPELVVRDEQGKPLSVRYEEVNTMLLNEFLKEHSKVEELEKTVGKLQSVLDRVQAQIDAKGGF